MKFTFVSNLQKVSIYARDDLNYPDDFLHISCLLTIEIWMCFQIQISTVRIGSLPENLNVLEILLIMVLRPGI